MPVSTATDENDIFVNVAKIRDERNQLFKHALKLRFLKRQLQPFVQQQKDEDASLTAKLFKESESLKGLKTKDERDSAIRAYLKDKHGDDYKDLSLVVDEIDASLLDVNLAIQELQKTFDEYELIYNFDKLVSMGSLIQQARHKLSDVISHQ